MMLTRLLRHPLGVPAGTLAITVLAILASTTLLWLSSRLLPWWPVPMSFGLKLTMLLTALVALPFAWALLSLLLLPRDLAQRVQRRRRGDRRIETRSAVLRIDLTEKAWKDLQI